MSILQDAQDNWPEDEASITADIYDDQMTESAGYPDECMWARETLKKSAAHMRKVFSREPDAAELIRRYDAALNQNLVAAGYAALES